MAFAKLQKATINFVMPACLSVRLSVRPYVRLSMCQSVRMEQLGSHWPHFYENWYLMIFRKCVLKIQVSLKYDKNKGYFT